MRILFVDDDDMNRRVVCDMLKVAGVDMDGAPGGEEGLAMVEANDYDIVLMDLRMPGMNGYTAITHIRDREDDKSEVPIIVVTADTSVDIREQCLGVGANEIMTKPVAMKPLFRMIGQFVAAQAKKKAANSH